MLKTKRAKLILIIILLLTIGVVFYYRDSSQQVEPEEEVEQEEIERRAERELKDAEITLYSDDGGTKWKLGAETIKEYSEPYEYELNTIKATVVEDEEEVLEIVASLGVLDEQTGFLSLSGPISIKSRERKIKVDRLNWNQKKNQLIGQGNVVITRPGMRVTADSFVSEIDLRHLELKDNVQVNAKAGELDESQQL